MPSIPILPNAYEGPPSIARSSIPAEEMPSFLHIQTLLAELGVYERHLLLAVYLYEYGDQAAREITDFAKLELALWTTGGWQSIAARDGAMTIYHFGCAIDGIKNSLPASPTLNAKIDRRKLKDAGNIFESSFPGYLALRHVVAHVADFSQTLEKKTSHAVKGPFKNGLFRSDDPKGVTWLGGNMNGCTYAVTYKGEAFTYDLNRESVAKLRSIKNRIYSAFAGAGKNEA